MKFETVLNATFKVLQMNAISCLTIYPIKRLRHIQRQIPKFRHWLIRRDEQQRAEIARLRDNIEFYKDRMGRR